MRALDGIQTPIRLTIAALCLWLSAAGARAQGDPPTDRVQAAGAGSAWSGHIIFTGLPVPGATVTATSARGEEVVTSSDVDGRYHFETLADGAWTVRVEILGFSTLVRTFSLPSTDPAPIWELEMLRFEEIVKPAAVSPTAAGGRDDPATPAVRAAGLSAGFQPAVVEPAPGTRAIALGEPDTLDPAAPGEVDGFLVNGSVHNAAASPFAQPAAFGNNRLRQRPRYTGVVGTTFGTSTWDARPYSFGPRRAAAPDYDDLHFVSSVGGQVNLPRTAVRPLFYVSYQRTADHQTRTQSAIVPTALERAGDFSQSTRWASILDPGTGLPFAGRIVPSARISPQAAALLSFYPLPNVEGAQGANYQAWLPSAIVHDSLQSRMMARLNPQHLLMGSFTFERTATDTTNAFGFEDASRGTTAEGSVVWLHRIAEPLSIRMRYQHTRHKTETTPYFANRANVSADAGIGGNDQQPVNWGPPALVFASGIEGLSDAQHRFGRDRTHTGGAEAYYTRGRHNLTFGGEVSLLQLDVRSQPDPRGTFSFTGAATGADWADFLLGIPAVRSISFSGADTRLGGRSYALYFVDDMRLSASLTINAGVRWEYDAPLAEHSNRLANLDIRPGFTAVAPVLAGDPQGALTGARYPRSLLRSDWRALQPRVGMSWRPMAGSSMVVRMGYGIYRASSMYPAIAVLLAQQPPLSTTFRVQNDQTSPLTLADGFALPASGAQSTFAVDPDFRPGYAHNWQAALQRDLPWSLTLLTTYTGAHGRQLMQQFLPNTYPPGGADPCPTCPAGFAYLTSGATSHRHAAQFQLRRRLRRGVAASIQYTLAKAVDDAAGFGGAGPVGGTRAAAQATSPAGGAVTGLQGTAIAQNWLDLAAERGPSSFDQRHLVEAELQFTTGATAASVVSGLRGRLLNGWTLRGTLSAGSGLPLTPVHLAPVPGTGVVGIRPDLTGEPVNVPGSYANPRAYVAPAPGRWGSAGRSSIRGPAPFALDGSLGRTFALGDRLALDWRLDATNLLNRVIFTGVSTIVGSPQFGLPIAASPMRKLQTSVRLRF